MRKCVLKNGLVLTKEPAFALLDVTFGDDTILSVSAPSGEDTPCEVIDCEGCYVLPGLTDIHLHGCAGYDLSGSGDTTTALDRIAKFQYSRGVTAFCPATMTLPDSKIESVLRGFAEYKHKCGGLRAGRAEAVGVNLEGPFISRGKCGAQNAGHILSPDPDRLRRWQQLSGGNIRLVTIAPEAEGAEEMIRTYSGEMHFSLGHTESGYDAAMRAFGAGADHVTHLFNAMPPFLHRDTGVIGAAFDTPECFAELICDGVHVSPAAVRAAFKLFEGRIILISDSMEAAGMPDGEYELGGQRVFKRGNRAELADGTIAGSVSSLYDCLKTAVGMGIPLAKAAEAAAITPCRSIGIDDRYGSIEEGKAARFLILNKDLSISKVIG